MKITGPYNAQKDQVVCDEQTICLANDGTSAELVASALNLWEMGSEDDTTDQLTAAHQMNLALAKQVQDMQRTIDGLRNRLPSDTDSGYGDNLIETAKAVLQRAGKAGSYDLATFDNARLSAIGVRRTRLEQQHSDRVVVSVTITLGKKCVKSGTYDEPEKLPW